MPLPKERDEDVGVSGFQDIKKIRGLLVEIDEQDQPEQWEGEGRVVKVSLEDTKILETFSGDDAFDLKDGKFSFIMPYKLTSGGKIAAGTAYDKCWRESAKELGKLPSQFIGEYVTLEKQARVLFTTYVDEDKLSYNTEVVMDEETGERKEKNGKICVHILAVGENKLPKYFCFVKDEEVTEEMMDAKVRAAILGLNEQSALRELMIRFKDYPEYKDALKAGTLAERLGLEIHDGKFFRDNRW